LFSFLSLSLSLSIPLKIITLFAAILLADLYFHSLFFSFLYLTYPFAILLTLSCVFSADGKIPKPMTLSVIDLFFKAELLNILKIFSKSKTEYFRRQVFS
jgi:hypothetical protein